MFTMQVDATPGPEVGLSMDNWNGYTAARQRLYDGVRDRGVENFVILSGDSHRSAASDLKINFDDQASQTIGTEFLGTSVTSGGNGADMDATGRQWLAENPHLKFHNAQRGYVRCEVTPIIEAGRAGIAQVEKNA
ncbi:alkaline phosphatase D family protein [Pseudarthrobacter sp. MDT3-26]|nr:alkaline phosphatase D family protein [Pseudarthrobacter sp. MDT3-26]MCO4261456.1 alkaline phosphatase D family protein [Pseudarthrobacter sp. MDT3-26]